MKFECSEHCYYVYLITNKPRGVFYVGVTIDLISRVFKHRTHAIKRSFTDKSNLEKLVWYEPNKDVNAAIQLEKRMKRWARVWKINLVENRNPSWNDLWDEITGSRVYEARDYSDFEFHTE